MAEKIKYSWRRLPLIGKIAIIIGMFQLLIFGAIWPFFQPLKQPVIKPELPPVGATPQSLTLKVDGFDDSRTGWTRVGNAPYLDETDYPDNYVYSSAGSVEEIGDWSFEDFSIASASIINVTLNVNMSIQYAFQSLKVYLWNGSWIYVGKADTAGWKLYSFDITEILDSEEEINNAKMYLVKDDTFPFEMRADSAWLEVWYQLPAPSASNLAPKNDYVSQADETLTFSAYWTANGGNLSHYIFSYKIGEDGAWTNETYSFPSGLTEAWSNVTKPSDWNDGTWIYWRFYANNTEGYYGVTEIRRVFNWESLPPVSRYVDGKSVSVGWQHIYYNGCKEAIYVAYLNTSFSPWKYQVRCFDMEAYQWLGPFDIADAPKSDTHWRPSISVLPDGRLIVMYCFYEPFKFRISQYSAATESNLTKLCSNWGEEHSVDLRWFKTGCYPQAVRCENYTFVLIKESGIDGNIAYLHFAKNNWVYSYVRTFHNNTYVGKWEVVGSYANEYGLRGDRYIKAYEYVDHYAEIGNFSLREGWAENTASVAYLEILAKSQEASICTSWNTTWLNVTGDVPTWLTWKVIDKDWNDVLDYIKVYSENDYNTTIYCVRLKLNITGCSPPYAFIDISNASGYFFHPRMFGDKLIVYGRKWNISIGRYNHYFIYSEDEGFTWKVANGTEVKVPVELEDIKAVDIGGTNNIQVWNGGGVIYNNTAIFLAVLYNSHVKNYSHPFVLIYYDNLGSPEGSWHIVNATYEDGSLIWGSSGVESCILLLDKYYNRPSIWFKAGYKIVKVIALPTNFTVYRKVYEDEEFITGKFWLIYDSPEAYEIAGENVKFLLGYPYVGEYNQTMTSDKAYGCKFTAIQSGYLTMINIYQNPPSIQDVYVYIKAALYDENLTLISVSDTIRWAASRTFYGWASRITFPNPPYIEENKTYWIVFKVNSDNVVGYAYKEIITGSDTLQFPNSWDEDFPSQIDTSECLFFNRKISLYGGEVRLVVRGLGHDVWAPWPTQIGVEGNPQPNNQVVFHTYWTDNSHLDYAVFYWNASGTIQENGTIDWTDNPTQAWSNFTRSIPPDSYGWKIAWYIVAYDVYGNHGNTSLQILTIVDYTPLAAGWNNFTAWDVDIGHTLAEVNMSLAIDNINWTTISLEYSNGTRAVLVWEQDTGEYIGQENATVESGCIFYIYCKEAGEWYHNYP